MAGLHETEPLVLLIFGFNVKITKDNLFPLFSSKKRHFLGREVYSISKKKKVRLRESFPNFWYKAANFTLKFLFLSLDNYEFISLAFINAFT